MTNMTKDREGELFMYKVYAAIPLEKYKYDMVGGINIFLTLLGGGSHMLHKSGKGWGSFNFFRSFEIICRPPGDK